MTHQLSSPSATSVTPRGVDSMASYVLAILSLKKTRKVESSMAPFMADEASRPGATNAV